MSNRIGRDEIRKLYERNSHGLFANACTFVTSFSKAEEVLHEFLNDCCDWMWKFPVHGFLAFAALYALNQIRDRSRVLNLDNAWLDTPIDML